MNKVRKIYWIETLRNYFELTKPRVTLLVVFTSGVGFYLASNDIDGWLWMHTSFATALLGGGTAVLNQFLERKPDGLMYRTRTRPLPSGRLTSCQAMVFGSALTLIGALYLGIFTNSLALLLGCATSGLYLFVYTPLKTKTSLCTAIGAIPGAFPPLIGWAAAKGTLDLNAILLFSILFAWQFPHFLAISWLYRDDYRRGGFAMVSLLDKNNHADRGVQRVIIDSQCTSICFWLNRSGLFGRSAFPRDSVFLVWT